MLQITEKTPTRLKLASYSQQWLWGVLFGLPFLVIGLGITATTSNLTTLTCQRTQPASMTCERTIAGLVGTITDTIPGQVTGASVISAQGTGVVLKTSGGAVELVNHHGIVGPKHEQIANKMNTSMADRQITELKIQQDDRWDGWIEGAAFFLPGLAVILASLSLPTQVFYDFDKISRQMRLERRYRLWRTKVTMHNLADMQQAEVTQPVRSTRQPVYGLQITTVEQPIDLSFLTRDRQQCQTFAETINQFLQSKPSL